MESPKLNNLPPEDDDLDARYRAHFSLPPLADDGFSERVLAALPPPSKNTFRFKRGVFCTAGLAAGFAVVLVGLLKSQNFDPTLTALDNTLTYALEQLFTVPVALSLGLALLSLWIAFRGQVRLLPRL